MKKNEELQKLHLTKGTEVNPNDQFYKHNVNSFELCTITGVFCRSKLQRDRERDVTEKIALGMAGGGSQSHEALYDQRLFNQNKVMIFDDLLCEIIISNHSFYVIYCSRVLHQVLARMTHTTCMTNLGVIQGVQLMLCIDHQETMTKIFMAMILRN